MVSFSHKASYLMPLTKLSHLARLHLQLPIIKAYQYLKSSVTVKSGDLGAA